MNGAMLLQHAAGVVDKRRADYGAPEDLFEHVAARWSQVLGTRVTAAQVALCLMDLKMPGSPTIQSISTALSTSSATAPA